MYKKLFKLWYPLAFAWLMISAEGPFLTAIVARLNNPDENLAAYGISFSIAIFTESLVIMLLSTSTLFSTNKDNYYKVRKFSLLIILTSTLIIIIFSLPPTFKIIAEFMSLPEKIRSLANNSVMLLIPWPAAIGIRRFYQGLLMRSGETYKIAFSTCSRLFTIAFVSIILMNYSALPGAYIGSLSLTLGVVLEALVTFFVSRKPVKNILNIDSKKENIKSIFELLNFYIPLTLTPIIIMSTSTLTTFLLGKAKYPLESLATMPPVISFSFLFASICYAYMELVIVNMDSKLTNYRYIKRFALIIGISVTLIFSVILFTPLNKLYFSNIAGLSERLLDFASTGIKILILIPLYSSINSLQRGFLIFFKETIAISLATFLVLCTTVLSLILLITYNKLPGIYNATIALNIGRLIGIIYLGVKVYKCTKAIDKK
ncbi:MAG: hypothetical protein SVN78_06420 [Deferribacterota bacterium]|nr:hypothetical protein [Deferribacterota bacterium]